MELTVMSFGKMEKQFYEKPHDERYTYDWIHDNICSLYDVSYNRRRHIVWIRENLCELYGPRLGKQAHPNTLGNYIKAREKSFSK